MEIQLEHEIWNEKFENMKKTSTTFEWRFETLEQIKFEICLNKFRFHLKIKHLLEK